MKHYLLLLGALAQPVLADAADLCSDMTKIRETEMRGIQEVSTSFGAFASTNQDFSSDIAVFVSSGLSLSNDEDAGDTALSIRLNQKLNCGRLGTLAIQADFNSGARVSSDVLAVIDPSARSDFELMANSGITLQDDITYRLEYSFPLLANSLRRFRASAVDLNNATAKWLATNSKSYLIFSYRKRSPLVGSDVISVHGALEFPTHLRSLKRLREGQVSEEKVAQRNERVSMGFTYTDEDNDFVEGLPLGASFRRNGLKTARANLQWGRNFGSNSRLSLELGYEDVENEEQRNDRTTMVLSISKRVPSLKGFSLPFSFVYSNKPEFVQAESDGKFSAHIGLKWRPE